MSVESVLHNRKSIRKFSNKLVSDDLLNSMLETASHTSTCGNMQLYSVVVSRNAEKLKQLAPAHFSQPAFVNAPVVLTFCADYYRFSKWCKQNKAVPGYNNFESFISSAVDVVALAQSFSLLAEESGLGICYLGTSTYNPEVIGSVLHLPKLVFPMVTLAIGYPEESPALVDRIPISGWVHQEVYQDYSEKDINEAYGYKEQLSESINFMKENQKETLAQVFTDIRYTKKDGEFFSSKVIEYLKKQDFINDEF